MHRFSAVAILSLLLLTACGGGKSGSGGGGGGSNPSTNPSITLGGLPLQCTVGGTCNVGLTATVTPGTNPASTGVSVSGDMHSCTGGSSTQAFTGSGTAFTYTCSIPTTSAGTFTLGPVTVSDAQSRSGTSSTLSVAVASGSSGGPTPVSVTAGGTSMNVNIVLPAPVASTGFNAQAIGAAVPATSGQTTLSLSNSPAVIHLSALPASGQMVIAVIGSGLSTTGSSPTSLVTSVTLSGPNDITVGSNTAVTSSTGAGIGIGFRITLGGSTATGARTLFLKNAQGDITAFTGGLEVLP